MVIFNSYVKLPEGTFGVSFISATWIIGREHVDFSPFKTCKAPQNRCPSMVLEACREVLSCQLWGEPIWVMWNSNCFVSFPNSARLGSMESPFSHISNHIYILYAYIYIHYICIYNPITYFSTALNMNSSIDAAMRKLGFRLSVGRKSCTWKSSKRGMDKK
jgi:hypothetical protein